MERIKHHYCWIKVVAVPDDETRTCELPAPAMSRSEWSSQLASDASARLGVLLAAPGPLDTPARATLGTGHDTPDQGHVPPPAPQLLAADLNAALNTPNQGNVPPPAPQPLIETRNGKVPPPSPPTFAGASFMGAWQFDAAAATPLSGEQGGLSLVHQPILGTRADAITWRFSAEGQQWCQDALAMTLMAFVAIGDF